MLDIVQDVLTGIGVSFRRIDGKSTLLERNSALSSFNHDDTITIMLASIGTVGEG